MAIRLSLDLSGATCGELIRFAETVRSAGVPAHQPIERSGPDRVEVSVAGSGTDPGSGPRPESYGPPDPHGTESYGPGSYGPESYGPESNGPESNGPESYGQESYGPESYGRPESYGPPQHRPPGRPAPGGPPGRPGFPGPAGPPRPGGPWPAHLGGPVPGMPVPFTGWPPGVPFHVTTHVGGPWPTQGAYLSVQRGDQMFATEVSTETVERWKAALSEALSESGLSETARGPLLELRALLNMEGFPRRSP